LLDLQTLYTSFGGTWKIFEVVGLGKFLKFGTVVAAHSNPY